MHNRRTFHNLPIWLAVSVSTAVGLALLHPPVRAQSDASLPQEIQPKEVSYERQCALSTVDYMAELIPRVPQPANQVTSYVLVGEILWSYDRARARDYFRTAFSTIDQVKADDDSDQEDRQKAQRWAQDKRHQLRLDVVRRVAQLDPRLERELIEQLKASEVEAASGGGTLSSHELIDLATVLLEDDPTEAISLAQASLDRGVSPDIGSFLLNLRQRDPDSADQLFNAALGVSTAGQQVSVDALLSLLTYAFPQGVEEAVNHGSSLDSEQTSRLLGALASRLSPPDPPPSVAQPATPSSVLSLAERASLIQQHLPLFEQYSPETVPALQNTFEQLSAHLPPTGTQPATSQTTDHALADSLLEPLSGRAPATDQRTRDRLLEQAAISAAHQGDVQKAEQILRRIQDRRLQQEACDTVNLEIALQAIADDDFPRVRRHALEISQVKQRAAVYIVAAEKLGKQEDNDRALFWLNEAYDFASRLTDSQEKVWTLFRLANAALRLDSPRAFEMAQSAVVALNRARGNFKPTSFTATLEQASLEEYITQAFDRLGHADFDRALYLALQLQALDTRVLAELAICRVVLAADSEQP